MEKMPVYVRIKPLGAGGGGGEKEAFNNKNCKSAIKFDIKERTIQCKKKKYGFPTTVLPPECKQQECYEKVIGDIPEQFILQGRNVNILAFGQTGSGKTHTLYSPPKLLTKSLKKKDYDNEDFGIFPRIAFKVLELVKKNKEKGIKCSLHASMVEIHMMQTIDILNNKKPVGFEHNKFHLIGEKLWKIQSKEDVLKLCAMSETRETGATLMNDSSSRSHCIVTLIYDEMKNGKKYRTSELKNFDLGGTEKLAEAHGEDVTVRTPQKENYMSAMEGLCINYSLFIFLRSMEDLASNYDVYIKKSKKWRIKQFKTFLSSFWFAVTLPSLLSGSLIGTATTRMFINVSQAPRNAEQSIVALDIGKKAAVLPVMKTKIVWKDYSKNKNLTTQNLKENQRALDGLLSKNSNSSKYIEKRRQLIQRYENILSRLNDLK